MFTSTGVFSFSLISSGSGLGVRDGVARLVERRLGGAGSRTGAAGDDAADRDHDDDDDVGVGSQRVSDDVKDTHSYSHEHTYKSGYGIDFACAWGP